jgi:predicted secreted hydrolase
MKCFKMLTCFLTALLTAAPAFGPPARAQDGFKQVTGPCRLVFPADHGPHPGYRTEWWYYTGNLTDAAQHRYGFQLTFFRRALQPPADRKAWPHPASAWRTDQIYLAHAALTDIAGRRHLQAETVSRPVLSLAGAESDGAAWRIYLHTWQAVISPRSQHLQADTATFALTLDLKPAKALVLHGQDGYSRKGQDPARASCYYSFTRLKGGGTLTLDGTPRAVHGSAWMDHEFSTAPLQQDITGWDWFGLQLSDGSDIMIFLLRRADGSLNPASSGTWVPPTGEVRHLGFGDVRVTPLAFWTSPHSGARYPVKWHLTLLSAKCDLTLTASLADQEMRTPGSTAVVYWEGSLRVRGTTQYGVLEGVGYAEMTGYAEPFHAPM